MCSKSPKCSTSSLWTATVGRIGSQAQSGKYYTGPKEDTTQTIDKRKSLAALYPVIFKGISHHFQLFTMS